MPVVTEDHDVQVHLGDLGVQQQRRRHVMKRADDRAARQHLRRLLRGATLFDRERVRAPGIEGQRVHAVDEDLACQHVRQLRQQVPVTLPGNRGDHDVSSAGSILVGCSGDLWRRADAGGGGDGPRRAAGSDDHLITGQAQPAG